MKELTSNHINILSHISELSTDIAKMATNIKTLRGVRLADWAKVYGCDTHLNTSFVFGRGVQKVKLINGRMGVVAKDHSLTMRPSKNEKGVLLSNLWDCSFDAYGASKPLTVYLVTDTETEGAKLDFSLTSNAWMHQFRYSEISAEDEALNLANKGFDDAQVEDFDNWLTVSRIKEKGVKKFINDYDYIMEQRLKHLVEDLAILIKVSCEYNNKTGEVTNPLFGKLEFKYAPLRMAKVDAMVQYKSEAIDLEAKGKVKVQKEAEKETLKKEIQKQKAEAEAKAEEAKKAYEAKGNKKTK